jgi:hypothetical protein
VSTTTTPERTQPVATVLTPPRGYEWVALSVTTVGALLAAIQGSSLIIALPDVLTGLDASFLRPARGRLSWAAVGLTDAQPRAAASWFATRSRR